MRKPNETKRTPAIESVRDLAAAALWLNRRLEVCEAFADDLRRTQTGRGSVVIRPTEDSPEKFTAFEYSNFKGWIGEIFVSARKPPEPKPKAKDRPKPKTKKQYRPFRRAA